MSDVPRLAVLDIDGTMTDSIAVHHAAFLATMESFAFPNLDSNWDGYPHHTDTAIFVEAWRRAGWLGPSEAQQRTFFERLEQRFKEESATRAIREIPGAGAFVAALRADGWRVVFATGGLRGTARIKLRMAGIAFDEARLVTASEHVTREELVTAAIDAALAGQDAAAAHIVAVGDGLWDMLTAETLGLHFLGVASGTKVARLTERGARVLPDFTDLEKTLALMADPG